MKFDVIGRINNMRLPDGKTAILYSVYEAVSNSIHAINDRFKEEHAAARGKVDVNIDVDENGDVTLTARKSLNDTQFLSCLDRPGLTPWRRSVQPRIHRVRTSYPLRAP